MRASRSKARALSAAALLVSASGCITVGPDFEPLDPGVSAVATQPPPDGFTAAAVPGRWWSIFDDPVLDELVAEATLQNLRLEIAALRVLEARAALGIATGSKYPQSQVAFGDASRVGPAESELLDLLGIGDFSQYNLGVSVAWELDFWGRYRRGIEAADAAFQASVASYDQARVLLAAQVVGAYAAVREAEEQLRISRENVVRQERSYEITDVLFRNGEESELDVQQALSLLLSTQATIPPLEAALQTARNALSSLLGQPPGYVEGVLARGEGLPVVPEQLAVGIPADMLRRRPDVREAELLAMSQNALVGVATADLYPSFQLGGTLKISSGGPAETDFSDMFDADALAYSVGGNFVWPFLNYDRIKNNIRIQDARLQQALLGYRDTVVQAAREAGDALANVTNSREQALILSAAVASAQRSNDLSTLQYREGFADYQRVLESQRQLFADQQRYISNQAAIVRHSIDLYKALGGGWEDRTGLPPIDPENIEMMRERTDWGRLLSAE